jgi:FtsP/CotA-like multicopper oxidase with cupredoxin domain
MNEMKTKDPGEGMRWKVKRVQGVAVACAIVAAGAAVLWARPAKPKAAPPAPKAAVAVQRLNAKALAATNMGATPPSEWSEPPVLRSTGKELRATLAVDYADNVIHIGGSDSKTVHLRSYNRLLTGPTLRVKEGDTLYVQLKNGLPAEKAMAPMVMNGTCAKPDHGFNITNLHTHGLHISPKDPSDNVLLTVNPGKTQDYTFPILPAGNPEKKPGRQYPGTFWYHAHNHGSTAMQLASGMAGALIVEDGPADVVPEVQAAKERLFVFQQFAYDADGKIENFSTLSANWNANQKRTAINGRIKPLIKMRRGEVERWRFIDSGVFSDLPISIVSTTATNFEMYRIAVDGITRPAPEKVARLELGPGYRTDLLVKAPAESGTYYLYKDRATQFSLTAAKSDALEIDDPQILAQLEVTPEVCTSPCATRIPARLKPPTDMLPDITAKELTRKAPVQVKFERINNFFTINESCFDINKVLPEFSKKLGDVEQWEILNYTGSPHPFHIHVNAFQLVDENGNPGVWHDTILVPAQKGTEPGKVTFRTRFERFDGKFVLHCHILPHEDEGMMQLVEIRK